MKNNTNSILTVVLGVCLLLTILFCFQYVNMTRDIRSLSSQVNTINAYRTGMQQLLGDCMEYSTRNSAINPILESVGLKQSKATPAAK